MASPATERKPWSADQVAFQGWLALPEHAREPRSQRELAAHLEVREATLSEWKRLPGWGEAVYALAAERLSGELVPVLFAQVREAKKGSLPHAQWLFEVAGKWSPKARLDHTGTVGVMTIAAVRQAIGLELGDARDGD